MAKWCIKIGDVYLNDDERGAMETTADKTKRCTSDDYADIAHWLNATIISHPDQHVRAVRLVPRRRSPKPSRVEYRTTAGEFRWESDDREGGGVWFTPTPIPPEDSLGWRLVTMATGPDGLVLFAWAREA